MASFDDFLKTGRLGPIATGASMEDVRQALGDPEDTSVAKHPEIWKYGSLQLAFDRVHPGSAPDLISITWHFHRQGDTPPPSLGRTGWMPASGTGFEEFRAHLDEVGIPVSGGVAIGPRRHLVLGSSARVTFDEETGRIASVGYSAGREAEFKQLSVSVPKDDFESIRREAKARGLSASALCSLWIGEHLLSLKGQKA